MPLNAATVRWSETESEAHPRSHVNSAATGRSRVRPGHYGENLAFNPWHCLPEYEPAGSISQARRLVYASSATERRNVNGVTTREPDEPKPIVVLPPVDDDCIVKAAIYPGIGVARLGNSDNDFFIGPEVPDQLRKSQAFYRDATGALKRRAARFRIYGLNAEGRAVRELILPKPKVKWTVHLANENLPGSEFQLALDIP